MKRAFLIAFAIAVAIVLITNRSDSVVGADASGYANLARMLRAGDVTKPLPVTCRDCEASWFTPLGFLPRGNQMVAYYPVGLPLHLLAGGFFVSPIAGVVLVLCTFWIGLRLHSEEAGLIAALLIGCCAVFVFQALQPMSDVPAAMWSVTAIAAAIESRTRPRFAILAGFAFGMAMLVRPTSLLLVPALALSLPWRRAGWFVLGGIPAAVALAWYDLSAFGSLTETGYAAGGLTREFALDYFPARAWHYAKWTLALFSPVVLLAFAARRWMLLVWFATFFVFYSFYFSYNEWWYTRFLLPAYPALTVAAAIAIVELVRWPRARAALVILVVAWQLRQIAQLGVLFTDEDQRYTREPVFWAGRKLPRQALVFSSELSGMLVYYTSDRPLRWDLAPADRALAVARSTNAPVYALLMPHEEAPFRAKYGDAFARVATFRSGALFVLKR